MDPAADTLTLIRTTFADREELVERAYRRDRSFRDLCEDYRRCYQALRRWDRRQATGGVARRREYAELLTELGEEIRTWLEAMNGEQAP